MFPTYNLLTNKPHYAIGNGFALGLITFSLSRITSKIDKKTNDDSRQKYIETNTQSQKAQIIKNDAHKTISIAEDSEVELD